LGGKEVGQRNLGWRRGGTTGVREGRGGTINDWGGKVAVLVTWGVVLGFDASRLGQKKNIYMLYFGLRVATLYTLKISVLLFGFQTQLSIKSVLFSAAREYPPKRI
jgi:hypothetical protein